ncbi:MAG: adenylyl-sulfate kinase [Sphaerochaeta sp.]
MEFFRHIASDYERALKEVRALHGTKVRIHARIDRNKKRKTMCEILYYLVGDDVAIKEESSLESLRALLGANNLPYSFIQSLEAALLDDESALVEQEVEFRLLHHLFDSLTFQNELPERIIFVTGLAGSGKTTMAAKVARYLRLHGAGRIALVEAGADSDRLLSDLAHDSGAEYERIGDLAELNRLSRYDRLIVDLGPITNLESVRAELERFDSVTIIVTDPANRISELLAAKHQLSPTTNTVLAITKIDEVPTLGSALAFAHQAELPIFALSEGSRVAQGFSLASEQTIFSRLHGFTIELSDFF